MSNVACSPLSPRPVDARGSCPQGMALGSAVLELLLDQVGYGIVCVSPAAVVRYCNALARDAVALGVSLRIEDGVLLCADRRETARLFAAIALVARERIPRLVSIAAGCELTHISLVPLSGPVGGTQQSDCIALLLEQPHACPPLAVHWYGVAHGLTSAERCVLDALNEGLEPSEIASQCGVALSTVRTQIASIRSKRGVPSIVALLRDLARLPPVTPCVVAGFRPEVP